MSFRLRLHLEELPVYVPGATFPGAIKLASNEVTFGPLPSVERAITDSLQTINRYPDNGMVELTASLAKRLGVTEDEIQVGCGSVSLCQNLVTITCEPGDEDAERLAPDTAAAVRLSNGIWHGTGALGRSCGPNET